MPALPSHPTVQVEKSSYDYRGVSIEYSVYVSRDESARQVLASAKNSEDSRATGIESQTIRLKPGILQRLLERLTRYEFEATPLAEQVETVTGRVESEIDQARAVQDRHSNDVQVTHVNGEPVAEDETPTIEVEIGPSDIESGDGGDA